jgi:hypothetical protein
MFKLFLHMFKFILLSRQTTIYLDGMDPESGDGMESLLTSSGAGGMAMAMDMDGIPAFSADSYDEGDTRHRSSSHDQVDSDEEEGDEGVGNGSGARKKRHKGGGLGGSGVDSKVKIALSLYKVQQNIYLLDFQRVEVSILFSFFSALFLRFFLLLSGGRFRIHETLCVHYYRTEEPVRRFQSIIGSFISAGPRPVNESGLKVG